MDWSEWYGLGDQTKWTPLYKLYGIYQIRITTPQAEPFRIPRIGGIDEEGILYIGRSGYRTSKSNRSLGQRLGEFVSGNHSGAYTYSLATSGFAQRPGFAERNLWFRTVTLDDEAIQNAEQSAIREYFERFLELPPYNGAFPGR